MRRKKCDGGDITAAYEECTKGCRKFALNVRRFCEKKADTETSSYTRSEAKVRPIEPVVSRVGRM